jgi:multidrug efflux system outer membrane protein
MMPVDCKPPRRPLRPDRTCRLTAGLLAAGLLFAAGGCALIHENGVPSAEVPPEQIRLADDIRLARDGWPQARWWTHYDDPQLAALIERALAEAPGMEVARRRVAQAKTEVELVKSGTGLQAVAIGAIDREHVSAHGFLGPFALNEPALGLDGPWYTEGIVGIGASLDIDLWGLQRAQVEASIGLSNARLAEAYAVELELSTDVAQLYYGIQTYYQLIGLLEQAREVATFSVQTHQARAARGLESRTLTEEAQAQLLTVERQLVAARGTGRQLRESLRALIGAGPDDMPEIRPVALPQISTGVPDSLSYELLARRPDLQALRWVVQASFSRIDAAKAAFYPRFDIRAFFGFNALHLSDLFMRASQQINLIPGLTLPIFDGGRLNANLGGARTASNTLIAQYNQAVLNAVRDVAITGTRLQALDDEAQLQRRKVQAVSFVRDSAEARYQRGLGSRYLAMEARQPLIAEQIAQLTVDGQKISQEIALAKALGGGYRADPPVELKPR